MDRSKIKAAAESGKIEWQRHALERMMERGISTKIVKQILLSGEMIEDYPDYEPYPSALLLGWVEREPFHVIIALDYESSYCFVITAYRPDLEHFKSDYKTRRKRGN